ncbi:cadmium carbonic anhydrase [Donghicola sp. B5-SW-15]|uniref:Cadmium carbonic anhydrase n=1 Tax=Donghicola mangrovi TaxID=2729614 RepID=A0A850Q783_9RHOB|nr:cadmium carbonic anhydrase [Donghicola mangrovi]
MNTLFPQSSDKRRPLGRIQTKRKRGVHSASGRENLKHHLSAAALIALLPAAGIAADACTGYGPQTPRDISMKEGNNHRLFNMAPPPSQMNLCNIHTHTNAEHKGPGFSVSAGKGEDGGWKCNESGELNAAELEDPFGGHGPFGGVKPGDTIEVHWVYSSCEVAPGEGLGSCMSESCTNPQLRVESQVFLVVNNRYALDFRTYDFHGKQVDGYYQPDALPTNTGTPVVFAGSTTGPKYTEQQCSPLQVTWSVRPTCAQVDISSLHAWAEENKFNEHHSHGVRQIVTNPDLLAPIN